MKKSMTFYKRFTESIALSFVLVLLAATASAQTVASGKVTDSKDGSPLAGVTVAAKGTKVSTQTSADGTYRITLPQGASTLVFTSVGFGRIEVPATGGDISLTAVNQQLNEVVVVAYGTRKKGDLTGAVTSVGQKEFQKGAIFSSEQLLVGKVAGLQVTTGGGAAGGGSTIRIRGGASLNASNDPLIVIDGVPVESNGISGNGNLLNTINPNDIESVSVLKDASAAALYGSRASNGVIIVTTKKGNRGKVKFNFNSQYSVAKITKYVDVLSGDDIRKIINDDAAATGINTYKDVLGTANTNWQKQIFRVAHGYDNNLSASGAIAGVVPFRVSGGYASQEGILKTDKFERYSGAFNLSPKLFRDNLSLNINGKLVQTRNRFADGGAVGSAATFDPTQPVYDPTNKYGGYFEWLQGGPGGEPIPLANRNPLALLELRDNRSVVNRFIGNVQFEYKLPFFPDLKLQGNIGMDNAFGKGDDLIDSASATNWRTKGRASHYAQFKSNSLNELSMFYSKALTSINSKVDVLVGHSYQSFQTDIFNYAAFGRDKKLIDGTTPAFATDKYINRLESYYGRVNFSIADKYLFTGSLRRDGSSKFSKNNRIGYFPAAAFAWKINEDVFKNSPIVNELKLRLGWGQTGQQDGIDANFYLQRYTVSNQTAQYQFGNEFYPFIRPTAYNDGLKWERTTTYNAGIDFGFFANRITGSVDVYQKDTKDLLASVTFSPGVNYDILVTQNIGKIRNRGVEVTLNTVPVKTRDFTWELGGNLTYNENKITELINPDPNFQGYAVSGISGGTGNNIGKFTVGYAPYTYNVYKQIYDPATGKPIEGLYEDVNRNGKTGLDDDADRYFYKKPAPDVFFGVTTQFIYKKWSLGATGHGSLGNYLYNNFASGAGVLRTIKNPLNFIGNASSSYLKTGFVNNQYLSDFYIENASFFRLDNINIGYNLGPIFNKGARLRLSGSIQNVFVITKYSGLDPENSSVTGVDNTIYPRPRIYSLGVNLDF